MKKNQSMRTPHEEQRGEIVIYESQDGKAAIDVRLQDETIWLTQQQIVKLFQSSKANISEHISHIFQDSELRKDSVVRKFRATARDGKTYSYDFYSLDVIIAVGYRVNAKRGTQFRIWATNVLRDHLVKGYTLNERRLQENSQRLQELEAAVELVEKAKSLERTISETEGLLSVITSYARSWLLLHQYDERTLPAKGLIRAVTHRITEDEAQKAIKQLKKQLIKRKEAGELFGREKERDALKGILGNIEQTFGGVDLYPGIEEKAAHLLYFIIKDHPFIDGNKRIA